jgi:hypothetical protein
VEICALKIYIEMLKYFIEINNPMIPVWKNLDFSRLINAVIPAPAETCSLTSGFSIN